MFFYHSRDDEWVPFAHLALYAEKVPHARFRAFYGRGHQFDDDLSEVAHDIEGLERSESSYCCQTTNTGELRFRALLSESGVDRLELAKCLSYFSTSGS